MANDLIKYFRLYRQATEAGKEPMSQFLGVTNTRMYVDKDFDVSNLKNLSYRVDAIAHNGTILTSLQVHVMK